MVAERLPFDRKSAQETDIGQGVLALEPTTEGACSRRRRCQGRDPTCQYKPNTTHAPKRIVPRNIAQRSAFRGAKQRGQQNEDPRTRARPARREI